jgi:hypothetical protein
MLRGKYIEKMSTQILYSIKFSDNRARYEIRDENMAHALRVLDN